MRAGLTSDEPTSVPDTRNGNREQSRDIFRCIIRPEATVIDFTAQDNEYWYKSSADLLGKGHRLTSLKEIVSYV